MFLPIKVAKSVEQKREEGFENFQIVEIALKEIKQEETNVDALRIWLREDIHKNFDVLMRCLLEGYEIDESKEYERIGLLHHPYFIDGWTQYKHTFIIFYVEKDDFLGTIWMPYYSKSNYGANISFRFKDENKSLSASRIGELHKTPIWFQELYLSCEEYIKERNNIILKEMEKEFEVLYEELKKDDTFSLENWIENEHKVMVEIISYSYPILSVVLKKLLQNEEELLCHIIDAIVGLDVKEYNAAKEHPSTWREYLLKWGRESEWI
ncbi:hypothetical protein R3O67_32505 [Bacillus cereus]|uniref:hypothetical protein n=1 Tax=Bacillus cereus TaxID=1396 RepID=UPI003079BE68